MSFASDACRKDVDEKKNNQLQHISTCKHNHAKSDAYTNGTKCKNKRKTSPPKLEGLRRNDYIPKVILRKLTEASFHKGKLNTVRENQVSNSVPRKTKLIEIPLKRKHIQDIKLRKARETKLSKRVSLRKLTNGRQRPLQKTKSLSEKRLKIVNKTDNLKIHSSSFLLSKDNSQMNLNAREIVQSTKNLNLLCNVAKNETMPNVEIKNESSLGLKEIKTSAQLEEKISDNLRINLNMVTNSSNENTTVESFELTSNNEQIYDISRQNLFPVNQKDSNQSEGTMDTVKSTQDILAAACSAVGIDEDLDSLMNDQAEYSRLPTTLECKTTGNDETRFYNTAASAPHCTYPPQRHYFRQVDMPNQYQLQNQHQLLPPARHAPSSQLRLSLPLQRMLNPTEYNIHGHRYNPSHPYQGNMQPRMQGKYPISTDMPDRSLHPSMTYHLPASKPMFHPPQHLVPLPHTESINHLQSKNRIIAYGPYGLMTPINTSEQQQEHDSIIKRNKFLREQEYLRNAQSGLYYNNHGTPNASPNQNINNYSEKHAVADNIYTNRTQNSKKIDKSNTHLRREIVQPPVPLQSVHPIRSTYAPEYYDKPHQYENSYIPQPNPRPNIIRRISNPVYDRIPEVSSAIHSHSVKALVSPSYITQSPVNNVSSPGSQRIQNSQSERNLSAPDWQINSSTTTVKQTLCASDKNTCQSQRKGQITKNSNQVKSDQASNQEFLHRDLGQRVVQSKKQLQNYRPDIDVNSNWHAQVQHAQQSQHTSRLPASPSQHRTATSGPRQHYPHPYYQHLGNRSHASIELCLPSQQNIVRPLSVPHTRFIYPMASSQPPTVSAQDSLIMRQQQMPSHSQRQNHMNSTLTKSMNSPPNNDHTGTHSSSKMLANAGMLHQFHNHEYQNQVPINKQEYQKNPSSNSSSHNYVRSLGVHLQNPNVPNHKSHHTLSNETRIHSDPTITHMRINPRMQISGSRDEILPHALSRSNSSCQPQLQMRANNMSPISEQTNTQHCRSSQGQYFSREQASMQHISSNRDCQISPIVSSMQSPSSSYSPIRQNYAIPNSQAPSQMRPNQESAMHMSESTSNHKIPTNYDKSREEYIRLSHEYNKVASQSPTTNHSSQPSNIPHYQPVKVDDNRVQQLHSNDKLRESNPRHYDSSRTIDEHHAFRSNQSSETIETRREQVQNLSVYNTNLGRNYPVQSLPQFGNTNKNENVVGNLTSNNKISCSQLTSKRLSPVILRNPMATPVPEPRDDISLHVPVNKVPFSMSMIHHQKQASAYLSDSKAGCNEFNEPCYQSVRKGLQGDIYQRSREVFLKRRYDKAVAYPSDENYSSRNQDSSGVMKPKYSALANVSNQEGENSSRGLLSSESEAINAGDVATRDINAKKINFSYSTDLISSPKRIKQSVDDDGNDNMINRKDSPNENPSNHILEYPVDELPSCSFTKQRISSDGAYPKKSSVLDDELFASSARANTPPSLSETMTYPSHLTKAVYCPSIFLQSSYTDDTRKEHIESDITEFSSGNRNAEETNIINTADDKRENFQGKNSVDFTRSRGDIDGTSKISENKNDSSTTRNAANSIVTDESCSLVKQHDSFLRLLRPVLGTLLSAPEAKDLRSLLGDPGRLLVELVLRWGGQPNTGKDHLLNIKKNFEIFLKLFITPEKCSEWGWEGRSSEDILHMINSENAAAEGDQTRVDEVGAPLAPARIAAHNRFNLNLDNSIANALSISTSNAQIDSSPPTTLPDSVTQKDNLMSEDYHHHHPPVLPVTADTILVTPSRCSPSSTDQTEPDNNDKCLNKHVVPSFGTKSQNLGRIPSSESNEPISSTSANPEKEEISNSTEARQKSFEWDTNIGASVCKSMSTCTSEHSNIIIKSFATSTTDTLSPVCSELTPSSNASVDSLYKHEEPLTGRFPTVDASPSDGGTANDLSSSINEITTSDDTAIILCNEIGK